ncbi:MAG: DUF554 domain-containing protein [Bacillota bacterium]
MVGTIVNAAAIVAGSLVGCLLRKGISTATSDTIMQGIGLAVFLVGAQMALETQNLLIVIISLVIGGMIGEWLGIEKKLENMGQYIESKFKRTESNIARGFVTASLVYCVGAMAILGSLEDGLTGNPSTLLAKSILDGVSSVFFASTMGIGVAFSAVPVFLYQGSITLLAELVKGFFSTPVIAELKATGGLLIVGISINVLGIKKINVGNLLPAVFVAMALAWLVSKYKIM